MFLLEAAATLPHAPPAVFAAIGGVEAALHWQNGVVVVRRARGRRDGALLLGYYALGVRHTLLAHVTAAEAPARFAYRAGGMAFAFEVALDLEPTRHGTRVTYRLALVVHPPPPGEADTADRERQAAALRRLLVRRAPRDLARLEAHVARVQRVSARRTGGVLLPVDSGLLPGAAGAHTGDRAIVPAVPT